MSNDRNEIVPLYYLQNVEGKTAGITGIFPLLMPEERFADVGAVVETALSAGERPVFLIKPMPGLEVRYDLRPAAAPLVEVLGAVTVPPDLRALDQALGPLTLLGYTWGEEMDTAEIVLYWRVDAPLDDTYTSTVQIFDGAGNRLAQQDRQPGGDFYPTGLWKPGEILRERHTLTLNGEQPITALVGMYRQSGAEFIHLAPALTWELP